MRYTNDDSNSALLGAVLKRVYSSIDLKET